MSDSRTLPPLYRADTDHSSVAFEVLHVGLTRVRGSFETWSAALTYDEHDPARSSLTAVIDVSSLDTDNDRRDDDLRSSNFFHVDSFPRAVFRSTDVREVGDGWVVEGTLTIRDSTQNVAISISYLGESPGSRSDRVGFEGEASLKRADFGVVNEGNILERLGVIGKEVDLEVQLSALRFRYGDMDYRDSEENPSIGRLLEQTVDERGLEVGLERLDRASEGGDLSGQLQELILLANRLAMSGRADHAAQILRRYVQSQPEEAEAHFWLGEMLAEAGDVEAAISHYRLALVLDPLRTDAAERIRILGP